MSDPQKAQVKKMTADLLEGILREVPDDTELEVAAFGMKFLTPEYVYGWYRRFILPHRAQVEARDEEFFKSLARTSGSSEVTMVFGIIARLWPGLADAVKKRVWVRLWVVVQMVERGVAGD